MLKIDNVPVTDALLKLWHSLPPVSVPNFLWFLAGIVLGLLLAVIAVETGLALGRRDIEKQIRNLPGPEVWRDREAFAALQAKMKKVTKPKLKSQKKVVQPAIEAAE